MKKNRFVGALLVAAALLPMFAHAKDSKLGIYVTPKFVFAATKLKNVWGHETSTPAYHEAKKRSDDNFGGSLAIGYDFRKNHNIPVRAELEYAILSKAEGTSAQSGFPVTYSQRAQTLFLNAFYDIDTGTKFTPYVGAGIGVAFVKADGSLDFTSMVPPRGVRSYDSRTSNNFAWNLGIGVAYEITRCVKLDVGYRFVNLGKASTNWTDIDGDWQERAGSGRMQQHQISAGVRISF